MILSRAYAVGHGKGISGVLLVIGDVGLGGVFLGLILVEGRTFLLMLVW